MSLVAVSEEFNPSPQKNTTAVAFYKKSYFTPFHKQINATWPEKCLQPGVTRCTLEHNHRLAGPLRAGRQDPVLPEELLAEHVSALKEWARIPVAVRTQVFTAVLLFRLVLLIGP